MQIIYDFKSDVNYSCF